jgi:23S rRNA G2445 N2-methylase RlmL
MKICSFVNQGMEDICSVELHEKYAVASSSSQGVISCELDANQLNHYLQTAQSPKRICAAICSYTDTQNVELPTFPWKDFITNDTRLKIEVENVKGQDNRNEIAKAFATRLFETLKEQEIQATLDLKDPTLHIIIMRSEDTYYAGIDLFGKEIDTRDYRVFPHSASTKGDAGFYMIKKAGFKRQNNLLVGFMKDGTLAIEAGLYATGKKIRELPQPFPGVTFSEVDLKPNSTCNVVAFDQGTQNYTGARKNMLIAGLKEDITIHKYSIEDLDVKFEKNQFDNAIFHITTKDEVRLNEIYYQLDFLVKSGGTVLFIMRPGWDPSISTKFELLETDELVRGGSVHKLLVLRKK